MGVFEWKLDPLGLHERKDLQAKWAGRHDEELVGGLIHGESFR